MTKPRIAVVLFNLGGPDAPEAVQPFLFNLFNDPAIIGLPQPLRYLLAKLIASRRAPVAREIYSHLGGGSPLVPLTRKQAEGLQVSLSGEWEVETFLCMRYWHPMSDETAQAVKAFAPEHIIALPLYPHYSTTTTASSFKEWKRAAQKIGLDTPTSYVCCYPTEANFIRAHAELIRPAYEAAKRHGTPRILFSAHGLPEKLVKNGDPYQWQIERTTQKVVEALRLETQEVPQQGETIDYVNCYQSRVGPLEWIKPSTEHEIMRGGKDGVPLVVVPIAFVSEHSETLVELDIEYGTLAEESGVPHYARVPALGDAQGYITALAGICRHALKKNGTHPAEAEKRYCRNDWSQCPCAA